MQLHHARAIEGPALFVDEPSQLSRSVADAGVVEGPALSGDEPGELSKSVVDARAVEGPALSVDEPGKLSKTVADARAVEGLCCFRLACYLCIVVCFTRDQQSITSLFPAI